MGFKSIAIVKDFIVISNEVQGEILYDLKVGCIRFLTTFRNDINI